MTEEMSEKAKIMAKKYQYKKLILQGKINTDLETAKKLIGPDCAYHLYQQKIKPEK